MSMALGAAALGLVGMKVMAGSRVEVNPILYALYSQVSPVDGRESI